MKMNLAEAVKIIEENGIKEIMLQFTDISGVLHSIWIPSKLLPKVVENGIHTDGSSIDNFVDVSKSDLKLLPDIATFKMLPPKIFPKRTGRVVCDLYEPESDKPFKFDPRFVLKKVIGKLKETLGTSSVNCYASSEMEFFVFQRDEKGDIKFLDNAGYLATPPADRSVDLRLEIVDALREMGILIEKHHHEVPPGKYELNIAYTDALRMADTLYLVKFLVKIMAAKMGLIASFMPKPFHGQYGAGQHTHISIIDDEKHQNLFYDPNGSYGLTELALHFLGGILLHARALAALTNPTVNSYKRLVPGWEAPVYVSWARYNRSVLVRVPPGKGMGTRMEYRPTDGSCNFYIAYAGILAAGLDGIKKKIEPPEPIEENIYEMSEEKRVKRGIEVLPENLGEALKEFSRDKELQSYLGEEFCKKFLELKTKEWKEFNIRVHEWERVKYLDV